MIRLVREYINYWIKAKNRHGVHSPFVYDFNDKCLRQPISAKVKDTYSSYKKQLLRDKSSISITDHGAGSKKMGDERKIKDIAKVSGSSGKYAYLLFRLVKYYQPKQILELGTSLGIGTLMMHQGNPKATIDSIEGCPETHNYVMTHHPLRSLDKINFEQALFTDYIDNLPVHKVYDFIFIDGDHRGAKVNQLLSRLNRHMHDETIILLDDIRWSDDMLTIWKSVTKSNDFHVSIDLFKFGVLVPRKHQATEHFVIRY